MAFKWSEFSENCLQNKLLNRWGRGIISRGRENELNCMTDCCMNEWLTYRHPLSFRRYRMNKMGRSVRTEEYIRVLGKSTMCKVYLIIERGLFDWKHVWMSVLQWLILFSLFVFGFLITQHILVNWKDIVFDKGSLNQYNLIYRYYEAMHSKYRVEPS